VNEPPPRFAKNYPVNVVLVVLTLFPGLIDSEAIPLLRPTLAGDLHANASLVQWASLAGDAALAFGVIASAALVRRVEQRALFRILLLTQVAGALLHATAGDVVTFAVGNVVQEASTGMLFVVALPQLITSFSAAELRVSAGILVGALFGAATLGPPLGGLSAHPQAWRWLFAAEATAALAAFALSLPTLPKRPALAPDDPPDPAAIVLPALGTVALFAGSGLLRNGGPAGAVAPWLIGAGLALYVTLLRVERSNDKPLLPVRQLETAFPLVGAIGTIVGNAAYGMANLALTQELVHVEHRSALVAGLTLAPAAAAAALAGVIFSRTLSTKFVALVAVAGLAVFTVTALAAASLGADSSLVGIGAVAFGFALASGLTITPGLLVAGLSVKQNMVGRAIALLELFRLAAGYAVSPMYARVLPAGLHDGYFVLAAICVLAAAVAASILIVSPARLQAPDLERYLNEGRPALESPQLAPA
jgi:MFS family permease